MKAVGVIDVCLGRGTVVAPSLFIPCDPYDAISTWRLASVAGRVRQGRGNRRNTTNAKSIIRQKSFSHRIWIPPKLFFSLLSLEILPASRGEAPVPSMRSSYSDRLSTWRVEWRSQLGFRGSGRVCVNRTVAPANCGPRTARRASSDPAASVRVSTWRVCSSPHPGHAIPGSR